MESTNNASEFVALTAEIVEAYLTKNDVAAGSLPELISTVHDALTKLGHPQQVEPEKPVPAVPIKKSVNPDYLISLEDGKHYKSLKRHLGRRGMTPADYRAKWGLPSDYPMVAPNYAKQRSELARSLGLGRKREPEPEPEAAPVRRGRRKAA